MENQLIVKSKDGRTLWCIDDYEVKDYLFMSIIPSVGDTMVIYNINQYSEAVVIKRFFDSNSKSIILTVSF